MAAQPVAAIPKLLEGLLLQGEMSIGARMVAGPANRKRLPLLTTGMN